ncbi:MAG: rod-binding protein [Candidatus Cloacimonetes bacterium]|nr:rod-binding protein [Candidatus Cloacimonadota bacterium]
MTIQNSIKIQGSTVNSHQENELKKLKKTTQDFEQIFVSMMLKEMNKNLGQTGFLDKGPYEKMFKDMLINERAKDLSKTSGFGIADQMYDQMKNTILGADAKPTEVNNAQSMLNKMDIERIAHDYRYTKRDQE